MQSLLIEGVRPQAEGHGTHHGRQAVHAGPASAAAWGRRLPALAALALLVAVGMLARAGLGEPVMAQPTHPVAATVAGAVPGR